jgi:hypothetical protein
VEKIDEILDTINEIPGLSNDGQLVSSTGG